MKTTCKFCGEIFEPNRFYTKYCSFVCRMRAKGSKLEYLNHNLSKCVICGKDFRKSVVNQITCSDECRNKRKSDISKKYYTPKSQVIVKVPVEIKKTTNNKAGIIDKKIIEMDKKRIEALKMSPNLNDLKPVIIDSKTTIYIKAFQDSEIMRQNFIAKYK